MGPLESIWDYFGQLLISRGIEKRKGKGRAKGGKRNGKGGTKERKTKGTSRDNGR